MSLRCFLFAGALALLSWRPSAGETIDLSADKARAVLHKHCAACHAGANARAGRRLLESGQLADLVKPDDPEASELLQLVEVGSEPRGARPKVPSAEVGVLRDWIKNGAKPFTPVKSDEYVLRHILLDQRAGHGNAGDRYFAFNHLLDNAETDPALFAAALTKALNLLSWKPEIVRPAAIDPAGTVFRVRLGALGWDAKPLKGLMKEAKERYKDVNLFDLVLLEYPYAGLPREPTTFDVVDQEYLQKAAPVRPVPFVRGDWFVTTAGRPPLYADLLRLPVTLPGLEKKLGVRAADRIRAGLNPNKSEELTVPRLIERGVTSREPGFWRSYELTAATTAGDVQAAGDTREAGGAAIFALPNGLPGFYTALPVLPDDKRSDGARCDSPPARMWKDGKRRVTGFACLQCHGSAVLKPAADDVAPALGTAILSDEKRAALRKLYPGRSVVERAVEEDNRRFAEALARVAPTPDPLDEIARRFRPPEATQEGIDPLPPLDGLMTRTRDREPLKVKLSVVEAVTGKILDAPVLKPGDKFYFAVTNDGDTDVWIEVVFTDRLGLLDTIQAPIKLAARKKLRFPPDKEYSVPLDDKVGLSIVTLFASDASFQPGVRLTMDDTNTPDYVADRFVHAFVDRSGADKKPRVDWSSDPRKMIKQTVGMEIR